MGKDEVIAVAIIARGGNDETPFEQADAVNTLGVIIQNIFFRNIVHPGDGSAFPVTLPAKIWDIHFVSEGIGILLG
jgi:hypothetical protein